MSLRDRALARHIPRTGGVSPAGPGPPIESARQQTAGAGLGVYGRTAYAASAYVAGTGVYGAGHFGTARYGPHAPPAPPTRYGHEFYRRGAAYR